MVVASNYGISKSIASNRVSDIRTQGPIIRGRVHTPALAQLLEAGMPVTLNWTLDNPADVESCDLILSTDGGATFNLKIAAYLPPQQHQLIWSASAHNATGRGKLKILLRMANGGLDEIVSDDFSILPAPQNPRAASIAAANLIKSGTLTSNVEPAFANPGPCVSGELPLINYILSNSPPASSLYRGEPSLAQNPTNSSHFHTGTGAFQQTASINSTTVNWGFSGTSATQGLNFGALFPNGDITTAIGADGTVYIISLARSVSGGVIDRIVIFRSKTGGVTFETGVAVPNLPNTFVDKPVVAVNPGNSDTLVITFNAPNLFPGSWVAICKKASSGSLSNSNNWGVVPPKNPSGIDLSVTPNTHPLIDPVDANTYWLFIVQPNDLYSTQPQLAGYRIYQYLVSNGALTLNNAMREVIQPVQVLVGDPPNQRLVGAPLWTNNPTCRAIEEAVRASQNCQSFNGNIVRAAIDYCDPAAHRMYIPTLALHLKSLLHQKSATCSKSLI